MSYKLPFSDIAEVVMGQSPKKENVNTDSNGFPLLNGPTEFSARCPVPIQFTTSGKKFSEPNDILFCVRGSAGRMNYADQKYAIGRGIAAIRGRSGYPTPYVRAVIEQNLDRLLISATGSIFPNVGRDLLLSFEVEVSSLKEAKVANDLFVAFEDKIEINRQTNQTLEKIAQAIFKSWFIDFDPVNAKIEVLETGDGVDEAELAAMGVIAAKSPDELAELKQSKPEAYEKLAQTAALFPSAMQESELGEIPEGWDVSTIGDQVQITGGGTPSTKNPAYWEDGTVNWTTPKDLSNLTDKLLTDTERKITESGLEKISSGLLPVDTVLMSSRAPVGYLALVKIPVAINQGYIAMQCKKRLTPEFVLQWASSNMDEIKQRASGTTFAEISKKNFRPISVIVPSEDIVSAYREKAKTIYDTIYSFSEEIKTLSSIRNTTLSPLLSGEIELRETNP